MGESGYNVGHGLHQQTTPNHLTIEGNQMTKNIVTQKRLKEVLDYNPDTGIFIWIVATGPRAEIGAVAGCLHHKGYIHIKIDSRKYQAHRLAFLYMTGRFPKDQTDHINHVKDDNRWINLRKATNIINSRNQSMRCINTSGCMGVYWDKGTGKWAAQIMALGKLKHLGYFTNKQKAIKTRKAAEKKYGYHENHGEEVSCN